jgi:hypothetical protein
MYHTFTIHQTRLLRWAIQQPGGDPPDVDWAETLGAARGQAVHLFLYPKLKRVRQALPDPEWIRLRADYLSGVQDAERRRLQAGELLSGLARAGIPAIPLKGLWLAEAVYPDPAERPMHDLDILVREPDFAGAEAALAAAGYTPQGLGDARHRVFLHPDWALPVELHRRLDPVGPLALEAAPLWDRAVPAQCAGQDCLALEPHDLVLMLVRHTLRHSLGFYPLRSLLDIALILRKEGSAIDLHLLHSRAQSLRMVRGLAMIVSMAGSLAGFEREAEWPDSWRPDPGLEEEAWSLTLERGAYRPNPPGPLLRLDTLKSWSARLHVLGGRLFLPRRELEARYPWAARFGLRPVAWAARLGYLTRFYSGMLVRLARRDPAVLEALDVSRERAGWLARIYPDPPA